MKRLLDLSLLLGLTACATGPAATSDHETTPDVLNVTASDAAEVRALVDAVGTGQRALSTAVDPRRGFVYAVRFTDASDEDPRRDASGYVSETRRVCPGENEVVERLARRIELHARPEHAESAFTCMGLVCAAQGPMEFAPSTRLEFHRTREGVIVLRSVYEIEDVSLPADVASARWEDAEASVRALPRGGCGVDAAR